MKIYNSNIGRAKLRREQFNRIQNKSQFKGKKSLTRRIIKEKVDGITADNIEREIYDILFLHKGERLLGRIMYHLKFGATSYPSTFDDDYLTQIRNKLRMLKTDFDAGRIDTVQYEEELEKIDESIMNEINNISQNM